MLQICLFSKNTQCVFNEIFEFIFVFPVIEQPYCKFLIAFIIAQLKNSCLSNSCCLLLSRYLRIANIPPIRDVKAIQNCHSFSQSMIMFISSSPDSCIQYTGFYTSARRIRCFDDRLQTPCRIAGRRAGGGLRRSARS